MTVTAEDLARLGRDMREAQKLFFKTKNFGLLDDCRALERKFDAAVKQVLEPPRPEPPGLFDREGGP